MGQALYHRAKAYMVTRPLNTSKIRQLELFIKEPEPFYNWNWPTFPPKVAELIKNDVHHHSGN